MQKSIFLGVRLNPEQGSLLHQVSTHRGCNQSEAVRWLIDQAPTLMGKQRRPEPAQPVMSEVGNG